MKFAFWLMIALLLVTASSYAAPSLAPPPAFAPAASFDPVATPGPLPKNVIPLHYDLIIKPDAKAARFDGTALIDIEVKTATATIALDAKDITFVAAELSDSHAQGKISANPDRDIVTLSFAKPVAPGKHQLRIVYQGLINAQPYGLYSANYTKDGVEKTILTTQFESIDARRMFPGWDEPVYKATYHLTVIVPQSFKTVSNMPVEHETALADGLKRVSFQTTPKMSSYLLELTTGDMGSISGAAADTKISVFTPEGQEQYGQVALEAAEQILPYYNQYFGVKYPLPKLDLIAIHGNYGAGAMENWGAITFLDTYLLYDPAKSSEETRQRIYTVIAHEMAHQWFGDLVTMGWWNDIWLNESFATWMNDKATDHFHPDWHQITQAALNTEKAMRSDGLKTADAVERPEVTEAHVDEAFDADITYRKGSAILRMIEAYIGPDQFMAGIQHYMAAHAYSSAVSNDLWQALNQASGQPVEAIARAFTQQPGIPLIKLSLRCDNNQQTVILEQSRFALDSSADQAENWAVPVTLAIAPELRDQQKILVDHGHAETQLGACGAAVKANVGGLGYYRVAYDADSGAKLRARYAALDMPNRVNLMRDQFALAATGRASIADFFHLVEAEKSSIDLPVRELINQDLNFINSVAGNSPNEAAIKTLARDLLNPSLTRLGWNVAANEPPDQLLVRSGLVRELGSVFDDPAVYSEAKRRYDAATNDPAVIPASLRTSIIETVASRADHATYPQFYQRAVTASTTEEKLNYLVGLGLDKDPTLFDEWLKKLLTSDIQSGLVNRIFVTLTADHGTLFSTAQGTAVWTFGKTNSKPLIDKVGDRRGATFFRTLAQQLSGANDVADIEQFSQCCLTADARPELNRAAALVAFKSRFRAEILPQISNDPSH